jgi:hypothetical protein
LAEAYGLPIFAEPSSGARFGDNAILAVIVGQLTLMQKAGQITQEDLLTVRFGADATE